MSRRGRAAGVREEAAGFDPVSSTANLPSIVFYRRQHTQAPRAGTSTTTAATTAAAAAVAAASRRRCETAISSTRVEGDRRGNVLSSTRDEGRRRELERRLERRNLGRAHEGAVASQSTIHMSEFDRDHDTKHNQHTTHRSPGPRAPRSAGTSAASASSSPTTAPYRGQCPIHL